MSPLETARSYIKRGWSPVPVTYKSKHPTHEGWQRLTIDETNVESFFGAGLQNVGVILGPMSCGLTDIDLDCDEAIVIAPYLLPSTDAIFGRPSARAAHRLYHTQLAQSAGKATIQFRDMARSGGPEMLIEVRVGGASGAQTVFPNSTHPTGELISWDSQGEPAQVGDDDLLQRARLTATGCLFARYWPSEGSRHEAALAIGGFLARAGVKPVQIKCLTEGVARAAGDPEVKDRIQAACDSARACREGKSVFGFPKLREIFSEAVAKSITEWLDYGGAQNEYGEEASKNEGHTFVWGEPIELPNGLKPVDQFEYDFLPEALAPLVGDISDRMQCPPEYVAVPAICALGSVLGNRVGMHPQDRSDWVEMPNLWGCTIGRPGALKTPASAQALAPLRRLEVEAMETNKVALKKYEEELEIYEMKREAAKAKALRDMKAGKADVDLARILSGIEKPQSPALKRHIVNDTTYEKLGEILEHNPNGVLAHRDELVSLLQYLDQEEHSAARGFFMTGWSGTKPYSYDRIKRGHTYIPRVCISLLGTTQPGRITEYVRRATRGGRGDDGMLQRFSMTVWPDHGGEWCDRDEYPNNVAKSAVWNVAQRLAILTPADGDWPVRRLPLPPL
jgi:hypothetical protein